MWDCSLHQSLLEYTYLLFWRYFTSICPRLLNYYKAVVSKFIVSQAWPHQIQQKTQLFKKISSKFKVTNFACANRQMLLLSCMTCILCLVPGPPPQLSSLAVRVTLLAIIRTASDDSCGGRPRVYETTWPALLHSCLHGDFPTELLHPTWKEKKNYTPNGKKK